VWFITPTVVLAEQQYNVVSQQLPGSQARLLTGADNVHLWSSKKVWATVLLNVRIVVSTPQVLLDALSHGFVGLKQIALLVLDEGRSTEIHRSVDVKPMN
jgi:ERCC4-related helicase